MKTYPRSFRYSSRPRVILVIGVTAALMGGNMTMAKPGKGKGNGGDHGKAVGQSPDFIPPGHRRAPVEVIVTQAPPPLRVEVVSARPSAAHVLVAGFWTWEVSRYVWMSPVWMLPPEPAAVWVQPRYEPRTGVNVYISGYWRL